MKKLVFLFTIFTFLFFTSSVQATSILTDNQLLIFNDKVITKDSSIEQINNMFGKPKVITESAFGGNAYSYYDDEYTWYLHIETDNNSEIKGFGCVNGNFISKDYSYGDIFDLILS